MSLPRLSPRSNGQSTTSLSVAASPALAEAPVEADDDGGGAPLPPVEFSSVAPEVRKLMSLLSAAGIHPAISLHVHTYLCEWSGVVWYVWIHATHYLMPHLKNTL